MLDDLEEIIRKFERAYVTANIEEDIIRLEFSVKEVKDICTALHAARTGSYLSDKR
jgi:hypothetical protein